MLDANVDANVEANRTRRCRSPIVASRGPNVSGESESEEFREPGVNDEEVPTDQNGG